MPDSNTIQIRLVATKVLLRNVMMILIAVCAHGSIATGSVFITISDPNATVLTSI